MSFVLSSGGRPKGADTGDCQVRALSTARAISYQAAWELLYALQGERRACSLQLVEGLKAKDARLGFLRELPFPARRGQRRMTGAQFCKDHPKGRFVLQLAHHVVAVVDGVMSDTWDSTRKCVYKAWEVSKEKPKPKMARLPRNLFLERDGSVTCVHREVSCCDECASHEAVVDVLGKPFWIPDPVEREKFIAEMAADEVEDPYADKPFVLQPNGEKDPLWDRPAAAGPGKGHMKDWR